MSDQPVLALALDDAPSFARWRRTPLRRRRAHRSASSGRRASPSVRPPRERGSPRSWTGSWPPLPPRQASG